MERPGGDGVAQQQYRGGEQKGGAGRQEAPERFADVLRRVHAELHQHRLAEPAEHQLETLQDAVLRHEKVQVDAGQHAAAADPDAPVAPLVQVAGPVRSGGRRHAYHGRGHLLLRYNAVVSAPSGPSTVQRLASAAAQQQWGPLLQPCRARRVG